MVAHLFLVFLACVQQCTPHYTGECRLGGGQALTHELHTPQLIFNYSNLMLASGGAGFK